MDEKAAVIRQWVSEGRLAPIDPYHLIFMIWATTQHYADFAAQVEQLTGRTLSDPVFFAQTRDAVCAAVLGVVLVQQG